MRGSWRPLFALPPETKQAFVGEKCVGAVVCKLDMHGEMKRGYIAMLVVDKAYRKYKIGAALRLPHPSQPAPSAATTFSPPDCCK